MQQNNEKEIRYDYTHPDYDRFCDRWKMAEDFHESGINVLDPDHDVSVQYFSIEKLETTETTKTTKTTEDPEAVNYDSEPQRQETRYEWYSSPCSSYLWKHRSEEGWEYEERQARACHTRLFGRVVDILSSVILKNPVKVDWDKFENTIFAKIRDDMDLIGTNIDNFRRELLSKMKTFGRAHVLVDMESLPDGVKVETAAQEQALGLRPYAKILTPLDIIDWKLDARGRIIWVVIREEYEPEREPGQELKEKGYQYRVITRFGWEVWIEEKSEGVNSKTEWKTLFSGVHGLGEVPIVTVFDTHNKKWACESSLSGLIDLDRHEYNKESDIDFIERMQCYGQLGIPETAGHRVSTITLGPGRAFTFPAEAGKPGYFSPDPKHAEGVHVRSLERRHNGFVASGLSRGTAEVSKEARTGEAITAESEEKRNRCTTDALSCQAAENAMWRLMGKWIRETLVPQATWPLRFELRELDRQINRVVQISSVNGISSDVIAKIVKPVLESLLRELGVTETINEGDIIDGSVEGSNMQAMRMDAGRSGGVRDNGNEIDVPKLQNDNSA